MADDAKATSAHRSSGLIFAPTRGSLWSIGACSLRLFAVAAMTAGIWCRAPTALPMRQLNKEAFLMTNIVPQTSRVESVPLGKTRTYARSQAKKGFDVYTIAGVYGDKGRIKNRSRYRQTAGRSLPFCRTGRTLITSAAKHASSPSTCLTRKGSRTTDGKNIERRFARSNKRRATIFSVDAA